MKKILSLLLVLFSLVSQAQYNNPRGRVPEALIGLSAGGKIGTTVYFGDLVDGGRVRWTVGGFLEKEISPWISGRLEVDGGQCKGIQEDGHGESSLEFKTGFVDACLMAKINFLNLILSYEDARTFNPYFGLGGGVMMFQCEKKPSKLSSQEATQFYKDLYGEDYEHADWQTYNGSLEAAGEVCGMLGVKYFVSNKLSLILEARGDMLFSDTFDGHDGYPVSKDEWESGKPFDCLWTISLGAQYRFLSFTHWTNTSSKYSRKAYLRNRSYTRNSGRLRRR